MSIVGLAHVGIYTKDMNKSKEFYVNTLGFEVIEEKVLDKPDNHHLDICMVKCGSLVVELLHHSDVNENPEGSNAAIEHLAMEVTELPQLVSDLKEKGIKFETDIIEVDNLFNGVRVIFFRGPSNEKLEFFEYLK